jgi:ribosomal protein S18 acetylase RimI-like enzyme
MNKAAIQITIARPEDVDELRNTYEEARSYKYSLGDKVWGIEPFTVKETSEMIAQHNTYVVKIDSDHAAGFQLSLEDTHVWGQEVGKDGQAGYIHMLVTRDKYRGQKLGEKIIHWIDEHLLAAGRIYARLDCSDENRSLCSYYEAQGFKKVGYGEKSQNSDYLPALYQKKIQ